MNPNSWSHERAAKVCARLRALRAEVKLSQRELAEYLGITQSAYSDYENGTVIIPVEILLKLCDYYMVSMDYLLAQKEERN